ncbi:4-(cytidine 5'-diphospho)-2-C-methyl-D-erythritol kinase [Altererythrobacter marinus]|uniref:4-diphosphocytidyl-2-C-methyl-D-erythritol kinase n=1 Tax=Pelagerythrobacter marinus TaxID=538382 RepID=A0ABW9URX4_9SPHN|nr:4-(cytidine 5'-diphospho)-2-C-methyl-D-erythritol kinase [Pelagerythrobacter marinus]MXO67631.1 4-(cytidine 5'-diphospho)-2-C-methyl-D-erythritol kinase [Pelagerythrobacter marinus]
MRETAYAKINLALHVRRRRADGYHELETLFAFVDAGDELVARTADRDSLAVTGEFAPALGDPFGNIAAKALAVLPRSEGLALALEKNLPVAAGLGGGSADAGAVFRIVRERYGLPDDWEQRAARLGADVPACVDSAACIGRGTGTELEPVENDLAGTPVLLLNPRVPVPTGPVFAAWDGVDPGPLSGRTAREIAESNGNDLERIVFERLCVEEALFAWNALADSGGFLTRMSGSGATSFALYDTAGARDEAAARIAAAHPGWWQMKGALR